LTADKNNFKIQKKF